MTDLTDLRARAVAPSTIRDYRKPMRTTHGHGNGSPTYKSWSMMVDRCTNPKNKRWLRYGGRGIKVCDRWRSFAAFLADMGERPEGKTIDRENNDGDYEPGNCKWSTAAEQNRNTRASKMTAALVREIVIGKYRDTPARDVAAIVGCAQRYISQIRRGGQWADVVAACRAESPTPCRTPPIKATPEIVAALVTGHLSTLSSIQAAGIAGMSPAHVRRIRQAKARAADPATRGGL